ncbi:beta-1,4-mannosyl-glycoprotein 4-beta-N-acetylglucosaminyltransferase-like [Tachypleus tridentatus]|uniref:beta-1,4-mannosyl-glycoprotein 4-beta-N-acetylglucosaminyltransferase-like n=1 Tax=Tachypleus tridentatus TaxID=6853 RepID=UPI003FD39703
MHSFNTILVNKNQFVKEKLKRRLVGVFLVLTFFGVFIHQHAPKSSFLQKNSTRPRKISYKFGSFISPLYVENFKLVTFHKSGFVTISQNLTCLIAGTNLTKTTLEGDDRSCVCLRGWNGKDCGFPQSFSESTFPWIRDQLKQRARPRRVINAININNELELFEIRVWELHHKVDIFLVCESNYTAKGEGKPLRLFESLQKGFLQQFQEKIVYVFLDHFPEDGRVNGWAADDYLRTFLGQQGLSQLSGLNSDDLFVLNDADEIPKAEVLEFLRQYDGYSEPIFLNLKWFLYGFFWQQLQKTTFIRAVCTIKALKEVWKNDAIQLRRQDMRETYRRASNNNYNASLNPWFLGSNEFHAGWHCSWCFSPADIQIKLRSAQNDDGIRWGDFPEKYNLTYIKSLIRNGLWFDNTKTVVGRIVFTYDDAPFYVLKNAERYKHLLNNSFVKEKENATI